MRYRLTFIGGAVVGYVLGARAGRERYEQLRKTAQQISQNPALRNAAEAAALQGRSAAVKTAEVVSEKVGDRLPDGLARKVRRLHDGGALEDDWGTSNP